MSIKFTSRGDMMQKITAGLLLACSICLTFSGSALLPTSIGTVTAASAADPPSLKREGIVAGIGASRGREAIIPVSSEKATQDQDFYKATVQAYKDFNEQTVKYLSIALAIVSILGTLFVTWFFFMFRKTLADIKNDLTRDADRLRDVYSRTFDLLNEQAKTNLEIFRSRESELKTAIREGQSLYDKIRKAMEEISDNQRVRERVAEGLAEEEVAKVQETSKEIKDEVEDYKKGLEEFTKDKT